MYRLFEKLLHPSPEAEPPQGRIGKQGDHRARLAQGGLYARLWSHQSGGFLAGNIEERQDAQAAA